MRPMKIYFVAGLGFLLLMLLLFAKAATGQEREEVGDAGSATYVRLSEIEVFLPHLPWMLLWASAGAGLGLAQPQVAWRRSVKLVSALAYVLGVPTYVFGTYWGAWRANRLLPEILEAPTSWLVWTGGLIMMLSLAVNGLGVVWPSLGSRTPSAVGNAGKQE